RTSPLFTRIRPAASRPITMVLSCASPTTARTPNADTADTPGVDCAAAGPAVDATNTIVPAPNKGATANRGIVRGRACFDPNLFMSLQSLSTDRSRFRYFAAIDAAGSPTPPLLCHVPSDT